MSALPFDSLEIKGFRAFRDLRIEKLGDFDTKRERFPIVKVPSIAKALPLRSLGYGMQHMLAIALSLVNARDGFLLIDEIENGLYYDRQAELWNLIFQLARQLNVQVFATSHSWDCITSFQEAIEEISQQDGQAEAMLLRLDFKDDNIRAALYNQQMLATAVKQDIEVR